MEIIVHVGFHKTGTTTLQRTLAANQAVLSDRIGLRLPHDLIEVARAARRFSLTEAEKDRKVFGRKFRNALLRLDLDRQRTHFLSCEDLAGLIPGRREVWSYRCANRLVRTLYQTVRSTLGDDKTLSILFTTRNAGDWMRSVYWQNLRSQRITDDLSDYCRGLEPGADLTGLVDSIKSDLGPSVRITEIDINRIPQDKDLVDEILGHLGYPDAPIKRIKNQNVRPQSGIEDLLALNRSDATEAELKLLKTRYLKNARRNTA